MSKGLYRKPTFYTGPYNYCDRWCERCRIDKSKCEMYQTEANDRLHHIADGVDPDAPEVVAADIQKNFDASLALMRERARELGIDLDAVELEPEKPEVPIAERPLVRPAMAIGRAISAFHSQNEKALTAEERKVLGWYAPQPGAKLARIGAFDAEDEYDLADQILSAQVAHRALMRSLQILLQVCKREPKLQDGLLTTLGEIQALAREIESRWLTKPCDALAPITDDAWWGPLNR